MGQLTVVPGTAEWGKWGIWYPSPHPLAVREYTHAIASFFRDRTISSTNSVMANILLGLDTPVMTPGGMAWETNDMAPATPPDEPPDGVVMPLVADAITHLKTPVTSEVDHKMAGTIVVLTQAAASPDYEAKTLIQAADQGTHRRLTPLMDNDGFPTSTSAKLLAPNPNTPTYIFGITQRGTTSNVVRTNGRFVWHSEQRCVDEIVRRRTPKEYSYISKKLMNVGGNDPRLFTIFTRNGKFYRLARGGYSDLLKAYAEFQRREEVKRKSEALRNKLAAAEARVKADAKAEELMDNAQGKKEVDGIKRRGARRDRSSLERWRKRLAASTLLGTREGWEKRRHDPSKNVFYYNPDPKEAARAFTYDPPTDDWYEAERRGEEQEQQEALATEPVEVENSLVVKEDMEALAMAALDKKGEAVATTGPQALEDLGKRQSRKLEEILDGLSTNPVLIDAIAKRVGAQAFVPLAKRDPTVETLEKILEEEDRCVRERCDFCLVLMETFLAPNPSLGWAYLLWNRIQPLSGLPLHSCFSSLLLLAQGLVGLRRRSG